LPPANRHLPEALDDVGVGPRHVPELLDEEVRRGKAIEFRQAIFPAGGTDAGSAE
jgi:hypothetical protein